MKYVVSKVLIKGKTTWMFYKGTVKIPPNNAEMKTKEDAVLKQLNKNAYNDLVLAQDDTLCFQVVE